MALSLPLSNVTNATTTSGPYSTGTVFWYDIDTTGVAAVKTQTEWYNVLPTEGLHPASPCSILLFPALATWIPPSEPLQPIGTVYVTIDPVKNTTISTSRTCTQSIVDQLRKNSSNPSLFYQAGGKYGGECQPNGDFVGYYMGLRNTAASLDTSKYPITNPDGAWAKTSMTQVDGVSTILDLGYAIEFRWTTSGTGYRVSSRFSPAIYTDEWGKAMDGTKIVQGWTMPALHNYFPELGTAIDQCQPVGFATSPNLLTQAQFLTQTVTATRPAEQTTSARPRPTLQPGQLPPQPNPPATTTTPKPVAEPSTRMPIVATPDRTLDTPESTLETPGATSNPTPAQPAVVVGGSITLTAGGPATVIGGHTISVPTLAPSSPGSGSGSGSGSSSGGSGSGTGSASDAGSNAGSNVGSNSGSGSISNSSPSQPVIVIDASTIPLALLPSAIATIPSLQSAGLSVINPSSATPSIPALIISSSATLLPGSSTTINGHTIILPTLAPGNPPSSAQIVIDSVSIPLSSLPAYLSSTLPDLAPSLLPTTLPSTPSLPALLLGSSTLLPGAAPLTIAGHVLALPTLAPGQDPASAFVVLDGTTTVPLASLAAYLATAAPELASQGVRATVLGTQGAVSGIAAWIMQGLGSAKNGAAELVQAQGQGSTDGTSTGATGTRGGGMSGTRTSVVEGTVSASVLGGTAVGGQTGSPTGAATGGAARSTLGATGLWGLSLVIGLVGVMRL